MLNSYYVDKPSPPGRPSVLDLSNDSVTLKWSPPRKDGGDSVRHYLVELKSSFSSRWTTYGTTQRITDTTTVISDLVPGIQYEFRVIAVNKAGNSNASEPSEIVCLKDIAC